MEIKTMSAPDHLKRILIDSRTKADEVLKASHVDYEVKSLIKDLLILGDAAEKSMNDTVVQSADARVLKKRLDSLKMQMRNMEPAMEKMTLFKEQILPVVQEEVKTITQAANEILGRHKPGEPNSRCASLVKISLQSLVTALAKLE